MINDPVVRGFSTAAQWFAVRIATFDWQHLDDATASLEPDPDAAERAQGALLRLRAAVQGTCAGYATPLRTPLQKRASPNVGRSSPNSRRIESSRSL